MTYNYLSIVNKVLGSFNEVKFSNETDFNNATDFQLDMREALNDILIEIYNREAQEWPFLKTSTTQVVTPGVTEYSPPATAAKVDWDSFYIDAVVDSYSASKLDWMPIDTYRNNYLKSTKDATDTTSYRKPTFIARDTNNDFITGPLKPDKAYLINYDYFQGFTPLTDPTDVPLVPEIYEYVILAGMKRRGNEFRDNVELASLFNKQFEDGIKAMRLALIPFVNTLRYEP